MLGGILILFLTGAIAFFIIDRVKKRYPFIDARFLRQLFFYHTALAFV